MLHHLSLDRRSKSSHSCMMQCYLKENMNILCTNMHYLRRISFAFVAGEHRRDTDGGSFRSIQLYNEAIHCTKKGGERMESDVCWPFSKPEDWRWPGMNLLCSTSAPLSSTLKRNIWKTCGENKKIRGEIKKIKTAVCFSARPSARSLICFINSPLKKVVPSSSLLTKHTQG